MRCSKCQYISFDDSDRCRNCGYEFSLSIDDVDDGLDLPMRMGDEPSGPLADFALTDIDLPVAPPPPASPAPQRPPLRRESHQRSTSSGELPLFGRSNRDDDAPLVSLPATPRAPVSVRKSTVVHQPPPRPVFEELDLDLDPEEPDDADENIDVEREYEDEPGENDVYEDDRDVAPRQAAHRAPATQASVPADVAPIMPRMLAALVDLGLLIAIDTAVIHWTLKLCRLEFSDAALVPAIPLLAFLALLNGGYVAAFTAAGGQTIGKMLAGIRVVTSEEDARTDRVPVGASSLRALGYLLSALPAGLGFVPVLLGRERRGLHDRLAHTRVVKA